MTELFRIHNALFLVLIVAGATVAFAAGDSCSINHATGAASDCGSVEALDSVLGSRKLLSGGSKSAKSTSKSACNLTCYALPFNLRFTVSYDPPRDPDVSLTIDVVKLSEQALKIIQQAGDDEPVPKPEGADDAAPPCSLGKSAKLRLYTSGRVKVLGASDSKGAVKAKASATSITIPLGRPSADKPESVRVTLKNPLGPNARLEDLLPKLFFGAEGVEVPAGNGTVVAYTLSYDVLGSGGLASPVCSRQLYPGSSGSSSSSGSSGSGDDGGDSVNEDGSPALAPAKLATRPTVSTALCQATPIHWDCYQAYLSCPINGWNTGYQNFVTANWGFGCWPCYDPQGAICGAGQGGSLQRYSTYCCPYGSVGLGTLSG